MTDSQDRTLSSLDRTLSRLTAIGMLGWIHKERAEHERKARARRLDLSETLLTVGDRAGKAFDALTAEDFDYDTWAAEMKALDDAWRGLWATMEKIRTEYA
jgi:hypothetical protein